MSSGTNTPDGPRAHLSIHLPPDWEIVSAGDAFWNASWTTSQSGTLLTFTPNATTPADSIVPFRARAPSNATRPFDIFTAQLSNGSFGQSSLVVRFPNAVERELPREAFPTVPYPVRAGEYAFFGVAFANGGEALAVTQVDVEVPGGYDFARNGGSGVELFGDAPLLPVTPISEWTRLDARHVRWRGEVRLDPGEAAWWGVGIRITDDPSQSTSLEGASGNATTTTLRFSNGYADASTLWSSSPGILRHRVPPAQGGASGYAGGALDVGSTLSFDASVAGYRAAVTQPWSYVVTPEARLLQLENGVTNSSLRVLDRRAPLGSVVQAEVDVQSVMTSLAGQGVTDAVVNVSVYAPPSMGCRATANWRLPSASLPKADATALELWDPVPGLGSVYLGAGDGRAYRVEATGDPLWTRVLGARPAVVATSSSTGALFVGDESGAVHRVDAAAGTVAWSADVGKLAVTSLADAPTLGGVLAGTFDGRLVLLRASDGASLASFDGGGGVTHARLAPDGEVYAVNASLRVERFSDELERLAQSEPDGPYPALAWTPTRLLAATPSGWNELDPASLAVVARHSVPAAVLHASSGDVDGDGADDLALALEDLSLRLVDGATGHVSTFAPEMPLGGAKLDPFDVVGAVQSASCRTMDVAGASTYRDAPLCSFHERNKPYAVRAQDGKVAYAFAMAGQPRVCQLRASLALDWCRGIDSARVPTRLAAGPFGAARGVAVASADGTVEVRSAVDGEPLIATSPSQSVGRFAIRAPVPLGGFFGSHLLEADVEWTDATGAPHAIGLADWFEVVDVDGTPVTAPMYRVVMVGRDRAEP